jgi:hypothetical protein
VACDFLARGDIFLELGDKLILVVIVAPSVRKVCDVGERLAVGVSELPCPSL